MWRVEEQYTRVLAGTWLQSSLVVSLDSSPSDNNSSASVFTWSSVDISSFTADDLCVAVVTGGEATATVSSVTIGGVGATVDRTDNFSATAAIASKSGVSGSTANFVATFSSTQSRARLTVLKITGGTDGNYTAVDSGFNSGSSGTGLTISFDIPAGGVGVVADYHGTQGTTTTYTVGDVTKVRDGDQNSFGYSSIGTIDASESERLSHTVTTSHSNTSQSYCLSGVSYYVTG